MAELGDSSRASHEDIGEYAARVSGSSGSGLAGLIAVGEEAAPLLAGARRVPVLARRGARGAGRRGRARRACEPA